MNDTAMRGDRSALVRAALLPSLQDFGAPLATLDASEAEDVGASVQRVADQLGGVEEPLSVHLDIGDAGSWHLNAGPSGCTVGEVAGGPPSVEISLDADTWRQLITGSMSALEAFGRGRMRLRGDIGDARRFARLLHRPSSSEYTGS
jgi:SCP-2 sterol transfer family